MKKITNKSTLKEVLKVKNAGEVLAKNGVPCVSCPMAKFEMDKLEIGQVCKMYGLNLEKILKDLNN
jgi:hypothetical protein